MKKMYVVLAVILSMILSALTGCASKSDDVVGSYKFQAIDEGNGYISMDVLKEALGEEMAEVMGSFTDFALVLEKGGKGKLTMDESAEITWERKGDVLTLAADGETIDAKYKSGVIELESDGMKMLFAKEGADLSSYKMLTVDEALKAFGE